MTPFRTLLDTTAPGATILVRILVGAVFLSDNNSLLICCPLREEAF